MKKDPYGHEQRIKDAKKDLVRSGDLPNVNPGAGYKITRHYLFSEKYASNMAQYHGISYLELGSLYHAHHGFHLPHRILEEQITEFELDSNLERLKPNFDHVLRRVFGTEAERLEYQNLIKLIAKANQLPISCVCVELDHKLASYTDLETGERFTSLKPNENAGEINLHISWGLYPENHDKPPIRQFKPFREAKEDSVFYVTTTNADGTKSRRYK